MQTLGLHYMHCEVGWAVAMAAVKVVAMAAEATAAAKVAAMAAAAMVAARYVRRCRRVVVMFHRNFAHTTHHRLGWRSSLD